MAGFAASMALNIDNVLNEVNNRCFSIAFQLFTSIVRNTPSPSNPGPWAAGHLANQWYPKAKTFSEEQSDSTSPNGSDSLSRINQMPRFEFLRKDGRLTLSNNLHYAYRAEMLGWPKEDGWSGRIGPYRMVAKSMQAVIARNK